MHIIQSTSLSEVCQEAEKEGMSFKTHRATFKRTTLVIPENGAKLTTWMGTFTPNRKRSSLDVLL